MAKREISITTAYFREYRQRLGFSNQTDAKNFFGGKDISPAVDFKYINLLNTRLEIMIDKINSIVSSEIRIDKIEDFKSEYIHKTFEIIKNNNFLPLLNNQGRRPEDVYFSWMRGFVLSHYFIKALGIVFGVEISKIITIGDDDLKNIETFKRTPKADFQVKLNNSESLRIEMQSGFAGTNDIKQHKVLEAKRVFENSGVHTLAIHFDLFNGQVAFIMLDQIENDSVNWVTRQQMEGQTVFNIDQNYFVWKITDTPIKYEQISFD